MKKYILLAGVNGAGKSTLFSLTSSLDKIEKINLDETVREIGDWRNPNDVFKAGKIVINKIDKCFEQGVSFSQETTLCGKSIFRNIDRAKQLGYSIEMHYVGLENVEIAKERVARRVKQGGHGISEKDIERRYLETLKNLEKVLPQCDLSVIYDNSDKIRRFAIYKNGKCVRMSRYIPQWFKKILKQTP